MLQALKKMHVARGESGRKAGSAGQGCMSQHMKGILNYMEEFAYESSGHGELIQSFKEGFHTYIFKK